MNRWGLVSFITVLLVAGFVVDLVTTESLIVAIIYNIPVALSGLVLSRRVTLATVGAALLINALAGFFNLRLEGFETVVVLNRIFAGLTFLFVGYLTLSLRNASSRATTLGLEKARAEREHLLREATAKLSEPLRPDELLARSATALKVLLRAESVVISGVDGGQFTLPRVSDPPDTSWSQAGNAVTWAIAVTPQRDPPVMSARLDDPALLLGEALRSLEPLLERAKLLENVETQRRALEGRNEVIRDLVYAFSHDLRTTLMANAVTMRPRALKGCV